MMQLIWHSVIYELTLYTFMLLLIENQWFYFFDYSLTVNVTAVLLYLLLSSIT